MKKLFFLLAVVIATSLNAMAQGRVCSGTVVDADTNEPLVGASVLPVGSSDGVSTDIDGKFSLTVSPKVTQVTVSYIGYTSATVAVGTNLTIALKPTSTMLDQVVVTGYGSAKKLGSVVGSVSVVSEAALENVPTPSFVDALSGQVPGLAIYSNTGEPASNPSAIRIRGVNSLEASNTPLFILDGAPVTSSVLTSLNSNDIENVTVLKDASATAIYGSRAANGVIVITSRKGKFGEQAKVTVRANIGWSARVQSNMEMMNAKQYLQFREEQAAAFGVADLTQEEKDVINVYGIDTDWQDVFFKDNALTYSLEAAIQGGSEKSSYFLSLGHMDQDGLIANSKFRRETLRANIDSRVKEWLKIGFQTNLGVEHYDTNAYAGNAGEWNGNNPIIAAFTTLPYDSDRYYTVDENGKVQFGDTAQWYPYSQSFNPNYVNDTYWGGRNRISLNASLYEQLNPITGLTIRAQQNVDGYDARRTLARVAIEDFVTPMGDLATFPSWTHDAQRSETFSRYYAFTYTNTAEYNITVADKHEITALLGQESIITKSNGFSISTTGQPNRTQMLLTNGNNVTMGNVDQSISEYIINSYFLQGDYSFDNRYFFNFTLRRDGSSKFAKKHRWATFFALGAMWNVKNEKFLQPATWIDDLKFRINYGTTGNSGISPYQYIGAVGTGTAYNGNNTLGLASQSNNDLTWETVRQFNVGLSYGFLNRIYGTVDFYIKDTKNMLMSLPYSVTTGWSGGMSNIGSMRNKGVDLEIGGHILRTKDWYIGARFNFNYNQNTITELFNGKEEYYMADYGMVYKIGENPNQLNTVIYAGVDPQDGKQMWYDVNGNLTKVFNRERDAVNTGKSFYAPWTGGFTLDLRWKDISLHTDWTWCAEKYIFQWANQIVQNAAYYTDTNQTTKMLQSWTHPGQITDVPSILEAVQPDSRYLENSSFCRMKNLTLTYSLPKPIVQKLSMSNVAFHFTGRNLLTLTSSEYTGPDPEYENNGVRFMYPNTRQYEFGVEVSF